LFRKEAIEPHYPTEDEQREIEKILSREFTETAATAPAAPGAPAKERGTSLNEEQRRKLAEELKQPYLDTLDKLDSGSESSDGAVDETEAFEILTQAKEDIYKRFGDYAKRITFTREDVTTPAERRKAKQVFVQFSIDPGVARSLKKVLNPAGATRSGFKNGRHRHSDRVRFCSGGRREIATGAKEESPRRLQSRTGEDKPEAQTTGRVAPHRDTRVDTRVSASDVSCGVR
jgi:hypothetical protein